MNFYVFGSHDKSKNSVSIKDILTTNVNLTYPCVILLGNAHDDFTYKTSYVMYYVTSGESRKRVGDLKILDIRNNITQLPNFFNYLEQDIFCSLGESLEFYENLMTLGEPLFKEILDGLNDAFINENTYNNFVNYQGFQKSLVRYSTSKMLFTTPKEELFSKIYSDSFVATSSKRFNFRFTTKLRYALSKHSAVFNFSKSNSKYDRIRILIGKNGTGKTSYLRNLALSISGEEDKKNTGYFEPRRPEMGPVIMVSYSIFDSFKAPEHKNSSYVLCKLGGEYGSVTHNDILEDVEKNIFRIKNSKKYNLFRDILENSKLFYDEHLFLNENTKRIKELSSGQAILLKFLTDIIKNIQENSLVLIDEIETHLHPNFLIGMLKFLSDTLQSFNSYCILSTHSPLVVQELDIDRALIFDRVENEAKIYQRETNYIGESLGVIVDEVFNLAPRDHLYSTILKQEARVRTHDRSEFNPLAISMMEAYEKFDTED